MSALPPKADICSAIVHVRLGPKADIRTIRSLRRRAHEHLWNSNAERFDVQSKVQTCFACSIRCIFVTQGCDLVKCRQRSSRGDFLMQLSSAIRAALMAL